MASTNTDTDTGNNESTTAATTTASTPPLSVCVIGGGPGAMSFCHSLETQKNDLIKKGVDISQYTFPTIVNCFERSSGPGGVWRSDRTHGDNTNNTNKTNSTNGNGNGNASAGVDNNEEKKEDDYENNKKQKQKTVETLTTTTLNTNTNKTSTNMYSALWTNGVKENFEFPDYTFVDHFGYDIACKLPTYLPRKIVLDYLLARCTNKCPNFFTKYFSFDTTVVNVKYLDDEKNENENEKDYINKFQVTIRNEQTGIISIEYYDKCIWAGGNQGIPYIPEKTKQLFEKYNENIISNNNNTNNTMRIVHSSDTANFKSDVENKNILIIGGGLSAEDLALMAIKEG
jgi:cation diffusion facilitator CzcD-associated flavoprotein CzcO